MRRGSIFPAFALALAVMSASVDGQDANTGRAAVQRNAAGIREELARAARQRPDDPGALTRYAEFLDRYGEPEAREAYRKLLAVLERSGDRARLGSAARRLARLDLLAGDRPAAEKDIAAYAAATGESISIGEGSRLAENPPAIALPGPMRSFARMAAIDPDSRPKDVLPALARNIVIHGYRAAGARESLAQTEYLKLLIRYISQARELQALAGKDYTIRVEKCDSPEVGELLRILGYRMRGGCGSEVVLETVNAARAFITTDSAFPVNQLEQALRTDRPFVYDYHPTTVPVVFGPEYWTQGIKGQPDFLDALLDDQPMSRLYVALAKLDPETAGTLRKDIPYSRLRVYAHVLDFYGGMFKIREGKAVTPGGARSAAAWAELTGVPPEQGARFFERLVSRDDGWMASYYDALARLRGPVAAYLTEPARMRRFYGAVRGRVTSPGPARPVFRANADMLLLTSRLRLDKSGRPHIPGNLDVWKNLFTSHPKGKYDSRLTRQAPLWKDPDDVVEVLFTLCRREDEKRPLEAFMAISDVDRDRAAPLRPATVDRLARLYPDHGAQYAIFAETGSLTDKSIGAFLDSAEAISGIGDRLLRSDTAGVFQSLIGLWQILLRQENIPADRADAVFAALSGGFTGVRNERDLFDAGRKGVATILSAAGMPAGDPQQAMLDLLAGGPGAADEEAHDAAAEQIQKILEAQRLVSLNGLFELGDYLAAGGDGGKRGPAMLKIASSISEVQLPRTSLSSLERTGLGAGNWMERHIDDQRKLNLRSEIETAASSPDKLKPVRGSLAPLLRDTLVGFLYAYYEPPGAQVLLANPLFVRSHDFIDPGSPAETWSTSELAATGWPLNGGGRLEGSLAGLPWALARAEQDFLVPAKTQALIWSDLAPQMIVSATLPRWWKVSPAQIHWVGLHLRYARELLAEAALDSGTRARVLEAFGDLASPARVEEAESLLKRGELKETVERITPSEMFWIARTLAPEGNGVDSCILAELRELAKTSPREVNYAAVSRAFGTPKPMLANSERPELLGVRIFPTLTGYSSRILAESWESNTLYWAALADELYLPPAELNARIPEWTRKLVENIFASNLEDWPAVLKSLQWVGEDERARVRAAGGGERAAIGALPTGQQP